MFIPDDGEPVYFAGPAKYWQYEPDPQLGRAVTRYLTAESLSLEDIRQITLYLKRWILCPAWDRFQLRGSAQGKQFRLHQGLRDLRFAVRHIYTRRDIEEWRETATAIGIDPF